MSFQFDQPDEFPAESNFLKAPGTYHMSVLDIATEDKDGKLIEGFRVNMEVLDGTEKDKDGNCTEKGKTHQLTFFNGKLSHKDGGQFARRKQGAFFVAASIINQSHIPALLARQLGGLDLASGVASQLVVTLDERESDGKKYLDVHFTDIWHVDDPAAAAFPKSEAALSILPASRRSTPEILQQIKDAFGGKKSDEDEHGQAGSSTQKPAPTKPGTGSSGGVDLSKL